VNWWLLSSQVIATGNIGPEMCFIKTWEYISTYMTPFQVGKTLWQRLACRSF
jgi:hypothetical protein